MWLQICLKQWCKRQSQRGPKSMTSLKHWKTAQPGLCWRLRLGAIRHFCVRVLSNLINEVKNKGLVKNSCLRTLQVYTGGKLVCQQLTEDIDFGAAGLATVEVGPKIISDIVQIGKWSIRPLDRFMSLEEIKFVLDKNQLLDGTPWTMRSFCLQHRLINHRSTGAILLSFDPDCDRSVYTIIESPKIEEIPDMGSVPRMVWN